MENKASATENMEEVSSGVQNTKEEKTIEIEEKQKKNEKEESVYVVADASGKSKEVIVSDWLKNPEGLDDLKDASILENIENVKGEETFREQGGSMTWQANGKDIYYQGTTKKDLPVEVSITYELDGKEISPEELAGKSGHVTMRFEYTNKETYRTVVNGVEKEVVVPFAVVSGMMLPTDHFKM